MTDPSLPTGGSPPPPHETDAPHAGSSTRRGWAAVAERWELRQHFVLPVLSSLATAAIIFTVAALLAPNIRELFSQPGIERYPIFCVVEPYNGPRGDTVLVDLFILNLTDRELTNDELSELIERKAEGRPISPSVFAVAEHAFVDSIIRVDTEPGYNDGKGEVSIARVKAQRYEFKVERIDPRALLRFTIVTNMQLEISSRSNRGSNPIHCEWPYRFPTGAI